MENKINTQWVIGTYTGDKGKVVVAHAHAGLGYFIQQESGAGYGYTVTAAFKRPADSPVPEHLQLATSYQESKLNQLQASRDGKHLQVR